MNNPFFDYKKCIGECRKKFDRIYVMGDIHGRLPILLKELKERVDNYKEDIAVILLGDVGANYYGDSRDKKFKKKLNNIGVRFYCLRGNHDMNPLAVNGMLTANDLSVKGAVYYEEEFPNIAYLVNGEEYYFNEIECLVLGGAYSVDKWYRLQMGWSWFFDEQISPEERDIISWETKGKSYDVILSHTCPYSWQPTDLFLGYIDQNLVDDSMEYWLEEIARDVKWGKWLFGHHHKTRKIDYSGRVMMLSNDYLLDLEDFVKKME